MNALWSSTISTFDNERWDEVKRKITISELEIRKKDQAASVIDEILKTSKSSESVYSFIQSISDIRTLTQYVLKTGKALKRRSKREMRVQKILLRISDANIQLEAFTAVNESLLSDRLATARAWAYLARIDDDLIRYKAAEVVKMTCVQRKSSTAWMCMSLPSGLDSLD
jgi:hypothetical protein